MRTHGKKHTSSSKPIRVMRSLLDPKGIKKLIRKNYDLPEPIQCETLCINDNDHFLIKAANQRYVFRVVLRDKPWKPRKKNFRFELDWLQFLKKQGLPVVFPIPRKNQDFIGTLHAHEGKRYWALFSFADGEVQSPMDATQSRLFGQTVARIHQASDQFSSQYSRYRADKDFLLKTPVQRICDYLKDERPADLDYLQNLANPLLKQMDSLPTNPPGFGIICGDLHAGNCHFASDHQVTLFDFDMCAYGWRAYDLAVPLWSLLRNIPEEDIKDSWHAFFLEGYCSIRVPDSWEQEWIIHFVKIRQMYLMAAHIRQADQLGHGNLSPDYWDAQFMILKKMEGFEKRLSLSFQ